MVPTPDHVLGRFRVPRCSQSGSESELWLERLVEAWLAEQGHTRSAANREVNYPDPRALLA